MISSLRVWVLVSMAALLLACSPSGSHPAGVAEANTAMPATKPVSVPLPPPAPAPVSPQDWKDALAKAYQDSDRQDKGDGVTSSMACFDPNEKAGAKLADRCEVVAFVTRDAFRNLRRFQPVGSRFYSYGSRNYLRSEVVLSDCGRPIYVLEPFFSAKNGWLFMNRVQVMIDGEVAFDRTFKQAEVSRDNESWGVEESIRLVIDSPAEFAALRKVASGGKVLVRLSGEKGYSMVERSLADALSGDINNAFEIYDRLHAALAGKLPGSCS